MKTERIAPLTFLYVLAFTLLSVGGVSLAGELLWDWAAWREVALAPGTAVPVFLLGALLFAAVRRRTGLVAAVGAVLALACLSVLLSGAATGGGPPEAAAGVTGTGIRPAMMCSLLAAVLGMFLSTRGRRTQWVATAIGVGLVIFGAVAVVAAWLPGLEPVTLCSRTVPASVAGALMMLTGVGVVLLGTLRGHKSRPIGTLTLAAGAVGILLACVTWLLLSAQAVDAVHDRGRLLLSKVGNAVAHEIDSQFLLLQRMVERWRTLGGLPDGDFLQQEVGSYLRDVPNFGLIAVLDSGRRPYLMAGRDERYRRWLLNFVSTRAGDNWLKRAPLADGPRLSPAQRAGADAASLALVAVPLTLPERPHWLLVAVMDPRILLERLHVESGGLAVRVYDGTVRLFDSHDTEVSAAARLAEHRLEFGQNSVWRLESYRTHPRTLLTDMALPTMAMAFALVFGFFAMLNHGLRRLAVDRASDLEASLEQQARLRAKRRETRRALLRREHAFRKLLDDTRDALLVVDGDGVVRYGNPAAEKLLRIDRDRPLWPRFVVPEERCGLMEWSVSDGDGGPVDVEVHCADTEWEGAPVTLLSLRDVRERRESEKQRQLLQKGLESSYNGVVITDARQNDHPIIYVNAAFERITGYAQEEVLGRNCRFLQGGERDPAKCAEIVAGLAEGRDVRVVLRNFRKDGSLFWNELFISPIIDDFGKITHFVGVQNDITEQKRYESELSHSASHDLLTGLPNRMLLEDRLLQSRDMARRHARHIAVMVVDLDRFKPVNDSFGHQVGDRILVEVAHRMQEQMRPCDVVGRIGGDEFIVLLTDLSGRDDAVAVAERLIAAIARPYDVQEAMLHITASIGMTLSDGSLDQPVALIQQADLAMHRAKQQGRNNYQWYTDDLDKRVGERLILRSELQKAIDDRAFEIHYQPQVDGLSGRVVGIEALIRWCHPDRGYIPPDEFIPVAEDTGQIVSIGLWVLETACSHIKLLSDHGMRGLSVAVNISSIQFQRSNFVSVVKSMIDKYALDARQLELELTESVLLDNTERAIAALQELKEIGVGVAIDDFGTGFSSLSYLKRLPIDKVKIDRSFVGEVISDSSDAAIAQGIISMAHHLKLKVIAEGVETEAQFAFLRRNHCDEYQGYYFARPMPFEALGDYLKERMLTVMPALTGGTEQAEMRTLLLLDDEENVLRALARVLRRDGYKVLMATRAQDAFALLAKHDVQVIISDQRMPEMSGTEFLSRVKKMYPDTVRIVLSGYTDLKSVTDAINEGAIYRFLTKPWDDEQLRQVVAQAFREFSTVAG